MKRRQFAAGLGTLPLAGQAVAPSAWAEGDPFTPGGSQDNIARRLSAKLGEYLGQSFVIDNRSGASGSIAADNVAKAAPDGYSVLLGNIGSHALVPHLFAKPPYNAFTDFETVVWIGTQPNLLCCHPGFAHDTVAKLITAAKAEPGKYQYGGSGQKTGADLTLVSYRGASASMADVVAGHLPLCVANIDSLMAQVSSGKLKPVASTGARRSPVTPDTPTFAEAGYPDLVVTSWSLWAVPSGTPAKAKQKLTAATERALQSADVIDSMRQGGFEPGAMPLADVDAFIKAEYKRWGEVIRAAGIQPQ